ncbi:MAG: hypothetical protein DLM67_13990 [Candidatus Nephthysia bennettiae]|uniref:Arylsulfotransferase family protein n=1 Tax=Candidatus Nephthysia bennettiae TaxID=3127016 RepID=A0A934N9V0_9BACT|nr:arylsulfotransferase family protein [Candidatus Dormibacteraeota bacterium]MBJ7614605.1 arylsulfotransferase family protein [Candidatus Dormibacteraeota bacterium]PZR93128.1 MAG: hypothetical protein DLM67_13990 [Candidatus Dormibacteraeota bacterium]
MSGLSRRRFLQLSGTMAAGVAAVAACAPFGLGQSSTPPPTIRRFRSRPDLSLPAVQVTTPARSVAPGYVFGSVGTSNQVSGPVILDNTGEPVWFLPVPGKSLADFRVQEYRGSPVLTWWEGSIVAGHGQGECVIADQHYQVIKRLQAGHGYAADLHEFLITPRGTAYVTVYNQVQADLSSVSGSRQGLAWEGVVQELDISSGAVLFEWHSLPAVSVAESYTPLPKTGAFDYFHINSVDLDTDGNLLVSARNTWTVYKVDRTSGAVLWRLGGKKSSFRMGTGTKFEWQHDARRRTVGSISLYDDAASPQKGPRSRGLVLAVDEQVRSAALLRQYTNGDILSTSQGNLQLLPNGNAFIGFGSQPNFSEFDLAGHVMFDAEFLSANRSYRMFRQPWAGQPLDLPAVAVARGSGSRRTVYVSWNGSTAAARWEVVAGTTPQILATIASTARNGFETAIAVSTSEPHLAVRALDAAGKLLATSAAVAA